MVVGAAVCIAGGCEALAVVAVGDLTVEAGAAVVGEVTADAVAETTAETVAETAVEAAGDAGTDAAAESAASETAATSSESTSEAASSSGPAASSAEATSQTAKNTSTLQKVVTQVRNTLVKDPGQAQSVLSRGEMEATARRPFLTRMTFGKAVERMAADDPRVADIFEHVGGANAPDFVDEAGLGYEVTTTNPATVAEHLARTYVDIERLVTYEPPPAGFGFDF